MADVKMQDRSKLTLTNVTELFNAGKSEVFVVSSDGPVIVRGKHIKVVAFNSGTLELSADKIDSITYG